MKRNYFLALAACALLGSASAAAAPAGGGSGQTEVAFQQKPGVWVFRDAATGKTLSGPVSSQHLEALRQEVAELTNTSWEGLELHQGASGSKWVDLDGRFQNVTLANIGPDGSTKLTCTQSTEAALGALRVRTIPMVNGLETE